MLYYISRRVLGAILTILAVISVTFVIVHIAPGDPIVFLIGEHGATLEYMARIKAELGLDKPLYEQYIRYMSHVLKGNLGYSFIWQEPVVKVISEFLGASVLLIVTALVIASLVGSFLGVQASKKPYSPVDNTISTVCLIGYSIPIFWLGLMLLLILSLYLRLFPAQGMYSIGKSFSGFSRVIDVLRHLTLPASVLALNQLALITRLTRTDMIEVMYEDFITTARAKGISERRVVYWHGLRNALFPVVTILGVSFGKLFAGAILTETIFGWPGMGRLMLRSLTTRDYPMLTGIFLVISILVVLATLAVDIIYSFLDPRVRYKAETK